jgi:hypothetical protein
MRLPQARHRIDALEAFSDSCGHVTRGVHLRNVASTITSAMRSWRAHEMREPGGATSPGPPSSMMGGSPEYLPADNGATALRPAAGQPQ